MRAALLGRMHITQEAHEANLALQAARRDVVEAAQMYISHATADMKMVLSAALLRESEAAREFHSMLNGNGRRETDK